jgi:acetyltransferase-like isoleucine patch superfamily enzyme
MVKAFSIFARHHLGPRTMLKSYHTYLKCQAGNNGKGIKCFILNGNSDVKIGNKAVVENNGYFWFGFKSGFTASTVASSLHLGNNSKLIIDGLVSVGPGVSLDVSKQAVLELQDVYINSNSLIRCSKHIKIGKGTTIGVDTIILDSDRHRILREDYEMCKPILISDHVWIGSRAMILKGVTIGSGSVVAAGAVVTENVSENTLVAGVPAKVIRKDVHWET